MFSILFIYLIINVIIYFTTSHVTIYSVTTGPLAKSYKYSALALRNETVVWTEQAGNIHYYTREGEKVGSGRDVYTIDEGGKLKSLLTEEEHSGLMNKDYTKIKDQSADFTSQYDGKNFSSVYDFKYQIEGSVLEMLSANLLNSINTLEDSSEGATSLFTRAKAPVEGVVVYSIDHMEDLTEADLSAELFNMKNYKKVNLRENELVEGGEAAYKLVTDEYWSLYFPLDDKTATEVADQSRMSIRFKKDDKIETGQFEIIQVDDQSYGKITLDSGMIRYASERYLDIELLINYKKGLKIPNSAIVEKQFFTVPLDFYIEDQGGFLRETFTEDGQPTTELVKATIYEETDTVYYVDAVTFKEGDYLVMPDSTQRYQLSEKAILQGVYNVNKGYTVFNQIRIADQNEEYCIVEDHTKFGLSQYDHIILNGDSVKEEDIVY